MRNEIAVGNCADLMRDLPSCIIDLTVTSPPYDNLRTYNGFVFNFPSIATELFRVTKDGGVVVWIVGDASVNGSETGTSFRQALSFIDVGFRLHDTMIYAKEDIAPKTQNRYEQMFEYMFVLSKGRCTTFNGIKDKRNKGAGRDITGTWRNVNGSVKPQPGVGRSKVKEFGLRGNIWTMATTKGRSYRHPAMFPERLAEDHILSWSNPGDLVFDPMCGSGTTLKMAKLNGRDYLGYDVSREYVDIARQRVANVLRPCLEIFSDSDEKNDSAKEDLCRAGDIHGEGSSAAR